MNLINLLLPRGRYFELMAAPARVEISWGVPLSYDDVGGILQDMFPDGFVERQDLYVATNTSSGIYIARVVDDALVHDRLLPIKLPGVTIARQDHVGPDPFLENAFENYKKHL